MSSLSLLPIGLGLVLIPFLSFQPAPEASDDVCMPELASALDGPGRYIGAKTCKNCHNGEDKGSIHDKWSASPHAHAFETLGTEEAKRIAAELDIENPQESEKCLECHVTAFGVEEDQIKRGFKPEDGVQCETCHGPGESHFKIRFKESMRNVDPPSPIGPDEVSAERNPEICLRCHNERSPTYDGFCFQERMAQIEHLDPRRERTEEELEALRAICVPDCPTCAERDKDKDGED